MEPLSEDKESNLDKTSTAWQRQHPEKSYSDAAQRKNANVNDLNYFSSRWQEIYQESSRRLICQAFHIHHIYQIFARDGVSEECLKAFRTAPKEHGPKLRNTRLDKFRISTRDLKKSQWNQTLIKLLSDTAKSITSKTNDKKLVKSIDWHKLFSDRFSTIIRQEIKCRPKEGETHEDRLLRLAQEHNHVTKQNSVVHGRHLVCLPNLLVQNWLLCRNTRLTQLLPA